MPTIDRESQSFNRAFNTLHQLYEDDKLEECIEMAQRLLEESAIPRYHRIKVLVTLASVVEDWRDAEVCRVEAEALWARSRDFCPPGANVSVDEALAELRFTLNSFRSVLESYKPEWEADRLRLQEQKEMGEFENSMKVAMAEMDDEMELAKGDEQVLAQKFEAVKIGQGSKKTSSEAIKAPFKSPAKKQRRQVGLAVPEPKPPNLRKISSK